jgi:hypothetical protein
MGEIMLESHDVYDAAPSLQSCPSCRQVDRVTNVSVVRGRTEIASRTVSDANGIVRRETRARPTPIARELSVVPRGSVAGALIGCVFFAFGTALLYASHTTMADVGPGSGFPLWPCLLTGAVSASGLLLAVWRYVRGIPVRRGRGAAEAVSRRGWYCERCGSVYFQPGQAPIGAEAEHAYTTGEFRHIVFAAGGYEHLA